MKIIIIVIIIIITITHLNRWVLRTLLNQLVMSESQICRGSSFQSLGPVIEEAPSPYMVLIVLLHEILGGRVERT